MIEPRSPALFGPPFFAVTLDPHNFEAVEASSDTFDHYGAIDMAHNMPIRLKLPFSAAMNHKDETTRLPAHDALHCMKSA